MSTQLRSGATTDVATVDPTSKALRGTLYATDGTVLIGPKTKAGSLPVVLPSDLAATDIIPVRISNGAYFIQNLPSYHLYQAPRVTTAAATDLFDVFNVVGSGYKIKVLAIYAVIQTTAASAIVPSFQFSVIQTNAVGTGGTMHTFEGVASPATGIVNISRVDDSDIALPGGITARAVPTGGATASKFLFDIWLITEDVNAWTQGQQSFNWLPTGVEIKEPVFPPGTGFKIRQITATASTGTNFGWLVDFALIATA